MVRKIVATENGSPVAAPALPPRKQLAFALLVFERMLPSLIAFSKATGFDCYCYLRAQDAAWGALQDGSVSRDLDEDCLREAPDTEEFSHELTSYALNAALAISDILEFILESDTDHIAHVLTRAQDSIYLYLSGLEPSVTSSPKKDRKIAAHPLMKQEQIREQEDILFLTRLPEQFDKNTVSALKERAHTQTPLLPLS